VKSSSGNQQRWEHKWKQDKQARRQQIMKKVRMKKMAMENPNFMEEMEREEIEMRNYLIDLKRRY